MQHAVLGEARVRAALLERFWVLNRSVDVDGADYLVQPRPRTVERYLDEPVRLGRVQAKFVEDEDGQAYVAESYVRNSAGRTYPQFFLLITTGEVDADQLYLLGAEAIVRDFKLGTGKRAHQFRIPAKKVFRSSKYLVTARGRMLDEIERALLHADRDSAALFFGLNAVLPKLEIDPAYTLPLPNSYGSFSDALREVKGHVQSTMYDMEDTLSILRRIVASADPLEVEQLLDDPAIHDFYGREGLGYGFRDVFVEDFFTEVRGYVERIDRIRAAGMETEYLNLAGDLAREVQRLLIQRGETPTGKTLEWTLAYDAASLRIHNLECKDVPRPPARSMGVPWPDHHLETHPVIAVGRIRITRGLPPFPPDRPHSRSGLPGSPRSWKPPTWTAFVRQHCAWISDPLLWLVEEQQFPSSGS